MGEFPQSGDNFATRGRWNVLEGRCWVDWQCEALAAGIAAARAAGDRLAEARLAAARDRLRLAGPVLPELGPVPDRVPD
jgi:hypothetical protein